MITNWESGSQGKTWLGLGESSVVDRECSVGEKLSKNLLWD